jgi:5-formyltetrahydrofolate cyclo-ligase
METDRKSLIRRELISRRAAVSPQERLDWSERIRAHLLTLKSWREAERVLAYCSMPKEVATQGILEAALREGKSLFLPRCRVGCPHFEAVKVRNLAADLEPGPLRNLMQPLASLPALTNGNEFDLVVVPGVAFDQRGYRIGFGAGMYDRFFDANPLPYRLALAFAFQVVDHIPAAPHDLPVHGILTENDFIETEGC